MTQKQTYCFNLQLLKSFCSSSYSHFFKSVEFFKSHLQPSAFTYTKHLHAKVGISASWIVYFLTSHFLNAHFLTFRVLNLHLFLCCVPFWGVLYFVGYLVDLFCICKNILRILDSTEFANSGKNQKLKIECSKFGSTALKSGGFDFAIYSPKRQVNIEYLY